MIRCMQRTNIYLQERQAVALDALAEARGVSRAEVIRDLIDRGLDASSDTSADLAAIDETFGGAPEFAAASRQPSERERHLEEIAG